jgi:hypothetical protein
VLISRKYYDVQATSVPLQPHDTVPLNLTHIWLNLVTNILTGFPAFLFPGNNYDVQVTCSS